VADAVRVFLGIASADCGVGYKRALGKDEHDRRISGLLRAAGLPNRVRPPAARLLERAGQRHTARVVRSMGRRSAAGYWRLVEERADLRKRFLGELDAGRFDAIVCPLHALPALKHGASEFLLTAAGYSLLYNVLGMPAGVVAATKVRADEESDRQPAFDVAERAARKTEEGSAGLPVGVQVVARHWREDITLAVMAALEEHFRAQPDYPARASI
jgi:fatty acid amide hydrolase